MESILNRKTYGEILKSDLGLDKFRYIWVQKVINNAQQVYIITFDSRFPMVYLSRSKLMSLRFSTISRLKKAGDFNFLTGFKLTPAIDITELDNELPVNAIIVMRDLAGHYYAKKEMFESYKDNKYTILNI